MPDWVVSVLIQYPIVVVIGFVAWYAHQELKAGAADFRKRERELHTDAVARLSGSHDQMIRAKDAEIARLGKDQKDEIRKLARAVAELAERLNP